MHLTMLNSMAGSDVAVALDRHVELGLRFVDLKDRIWDRKVEELDDERVAMLEVLLRKQRLSVHCLSTGLGWTDVSIGEIAWRSTQMDILRRVLHVATTLRPHYIRLLGIRFANAAGSRPSFREAVMTHPWLPSAYCDLVREITAAGFTACLENEARHCALATPDDVLEFYTVLKPLLGDIPCGYIWDVQNMWQMGSFPSLSGYMKLRSIISSLHLKGGRADADGRLIEACGLRRASWPVLQILAEVNRDAKIDVICLNPSHGTRPEGYDIWQTVQDDIAYIRENYNTWH